MPRRMRRAALAIVDDAPYPPSADVDLKAVEEFAAGLKKTFLHCRELGHLWRPFRARRHPDGGFERTLRCSRCGTTRRQSLSSRGMVLSNVYEHPEGYLTNGLGRIVGEGRGLLRLESISRDIEAAMEGEQ